jgi:hypothetical protein
MQAPEQERDAPHQIEKNEASHGFPVNKFGSKGQAIGNYRWINSFISADWSKFGRRKIWFEATLTAGR